MDGAAAYIYLEADEKGEVSLKKLRTLAERLIIIIARAFLS